MRDKVYETIYVTDDYDKFRKLDGNRDVNGIKKVINSIMQVGYVLSPILVNEKMEVIDGQTRLEALKALRLPVPYMVQKGLGLKECRAVNIGQSNWTTRDFIRSYAESGNESYMRLQGIVDDYVKQFTMEGVLSITFPKLISLNGGGVYTFIKEGKAKLTDKQEAEARKRFASMIALGFTKFKQDYDLRGRTYWAAVSYAYQHEGVDPAELIKKMEEDPLKIVSCAKVPDQLAYFDEAYNKRKRTQSKVFMAADMQTGKYIS